MVQASGEEVAQTGGEPGGGGEGGGEGGGDEGGGDGGGDGGGGDGGDDGGGGDGEVVINILDMASPPSPDGTMAEKLMAAFPDLEELFSSEEILELWGEGA